VYGGQPVARGNPEGLPPGRGAFTAYDDFGDSFWVRANVDNHYGDQCRTEYRRIWNPIDEQEEIFYPYGVRWVDSLFWSKEGNSWRQVTYDCLYPGAPQPVQMNCAYWGAGELQGPLPNSKGLPVIKDDGTPDIRTTPREWSASRTSTTLGAMFDKRGKDPLLGMSAAAFAKYVSSNCSDFDYLGWFNDEKCTTLYGGKNLSGENCAVVPGNYQNKFRGQQMKCSWTYYPYWDVYRPSGCFERPQIKENRPYALYCKGLSPAGRGGFYNGYDTVYNFATCGNSFIPPRCNFEGGSTPLVIDPSGQRESLSTQMLANGLQWTLEFPNLTVVGAKNKRQQWILAEGSQPVKGTDYGSAEQPFLAHFNPQEKQRGVLKGIQSNVAFPGWDRDKLYLRVFRSGGIADSGSVIVGQGEVSNPARADKNTIIPLGIYAKYLFTTKQTITTPISGRITIDVPMSCDTPMVTLYSVSGRATG
jgi:hypothetical protein